MPATKTQRFTLYLLTLLFIWVNGFAAPYQCITDLPNEVVVKANPKQQDDYRPFEALEHSTQGQFQQPVAITDQGMHSAYPPEETFEEQEESHQRKDEEGFIYITLPQFLAQVHLSTVNTPIYFPHHEWFSAVRKQSTYLLDCTFLI